MTHVHVEQVAFTASPSALHSLTTSISSSPYCNRWTSASTTVNNLATPPHTFPAPRVSISTSSSPFSAPGTKCGMRTTHHSSPRSRGRDSCRVHPPHCRGSAVRRHKPGGRIRGSLLYAPRATLHTRCVRLPATCVDTYGSASYEVHTPDPPGLSPMHVPGRRGGSGSPGVVCGFGEHGVLGRQATVT